MPKNTIIKPRTVAEISHNAKIKIYPDGTVRTTVCSAPVYRETGWETAGNRTYVPQERRAAEGGEAVGSERSLLRARNKIFDIALCNEWEFFVTLTLSDSSIERYNPQVVSKAVKQWCRNMQYRHGMRYVLIPELHKDGAVHLHGLMSGDIAAVKAVTPDGKPIYQNRRRVWNVTRWKYGYSTATKTGNGLAAAKYITKYITKSMSGGGGDTAKIFGNYYYAGGDIRRTPDIELADVDFENYVETNEITPHRCKATGQLFAYHETKKGE